MKLPFGYKLEKVEFVTLEKDGKTVEVPLLDEIPPRMLKKILKNAGVSEEEFIKGCEEGEFD